MIAENDLGNCARRVEVPLAVRFRGVEVGDYRADMVVEGKVIVESKVAERIIPAHEMQLLNYPRATGITVGLVLNFGPAPRSDGYCCRPPVLDP
jgi:GxxExxY protein